MSEQISVVLPYFNRSDVLASAVRSVQAQTYSNFELILVDDGSTDGSFDVARRVAESDRRVIHVRRSENRGVCLARNSGIDRASASLLAFMDSDDLWLPNKLAIQRDRLRSAQRRSSEIAVIGCGWQHIDTHPAPKEFLPGPYRRKDILRARVAGVGTPMLVVDRRVASSARFDRRFPALEERDFLLSCLAEGQRVIVAPQVLAQVRRNRDDHVASPHRAAVAYELLLDKYAEEMVETPEIAAFYHFRAAREHLIDRNLASGIRHGRSALHDHTQRRLIHLILGAVAGAKGLAAAQLVAPVPTAA